MFGKVLRPGCKATYRGMLSAVNEVAKCATSSPRCSGSATRATRSIGSRRDRNRPCHRCYLARWAQVIKTAGIRID